MPLTSLLALEGSLGLVPSVDGLTVGYYLLYSGIYGNIDGVELLDFFVRFKFGTVATVPQAAEAPQKKQTCQDNDKLPSR